MAASVCRWWRQSALATPKLWSSISIDLTTDDTTHEQEIAASRVWYERSRAWPLSFTVIAWPFRRLEKPVVDLLTACPHRWEDVKLEGLHHKDLETLFSFTDTFPLLRSILVLGGYNDAPLSLTAPSSDESDGECRLTPMLKSLTMDYDMFPPSFIPWSHLTECHLEGSGDLSFSECIDILGQCELLLMATIQFHNRLEDPSGIITLPHLHTLRITEAIDDDDAELGGGPWPGVFDWLDLPSLTALDFEGYYWDSQPFLEFLSRSSCSLRKLDIHLSSDFEHQDFDRMAILGCTPHLEEYLPSSAYSYGSLMSDALGVVDNEMLERLVRPGEPTLLPNLRSIWVYAGDDFEASLRKAVEVITSRWFIDPECSRPHDIPIRRLEKVAIHLPEYPICLLSPDSCISLDLLQTMQRDGLQVQIVDCNRRPLQL